jgi:2-oxoglutarate ferredoxin oxidoreductase subunit delta
MKDKKIRKARGTVIIKDAMCKGCAYCVEFCPTRALHISKRYNAKGYRLPELVDAGLCTGCGLCGLYCPDFAIHGYIIDTAVKETV